jgi:hypothetical protein
MTTRDYRCNSLLVAMNAASARIKEVTGIYPINCSEMADLVCALYKMERAFSTDEEIRETIRQYMEDLESEEE